MTCRTRFAPSPTGYLHIGGARTALYCWLEARRRGGEFILRIEDTDRERSTQAAIDAILEAMALARPRLRRGPGLPDPAPGPLSTRWPSSCVAAGKAYYAYETKDELEAMREAAMADEREAPLQRRLPRPRRSRCRDDPNRVIRFRNPQDGAVAWEDKVKGRIEIANSELDDLVIFRSDGYPTYNFAVVVDDIDMAHHRRGARRRPRQQHAAPDQHLSTRSGAPVPQFAHLPMILDEQGAKLSKRTGAADVMQYRDDGYLPHALLNYLVRLGWSHGDQEIFSIEEMTRCSTSRTSTRRPRAWIRRSSAGSTSSTSRATIPQTSPRTCSGTSQQRRLRPRQRARRRSTSWSRCATACRRSRKWPSARRSGTSPLDGVRRRGGGQAPDARPRVAR